MTNRPEGEKKSSTTYSTKLIRYVYFIKDTFRAYGSFFLPVILVGLEATNNEKQIFSKLKDQILFS
jgi:hypothetical protein